MIFVWLQRVNGDHFRLKRLYRVYGDFGPTSWMGLNVRAEVEKAGFATQTGEIIGGIAFTIT
jgi:hypothetical protein